MAKPTDIFIRSDIPVAFAKFPRGCETFTAVDDLVDASGDERGQEVNCDFPCVHFLLVAPQLTWPSPESAFACKLFFMAYEAWKP